MWKYLAGYLPFEGEIPGVLKVNETSPELTLNGKIPNPPVWLETLPQKTP